MNRFIYLYLTVGDVRRGWNSYFLASYIMTFLPTENFVTKRTLVTSLLFPKMDGVALASRTKT